MGNCINAMSLFASGGIGETYLENIGICVKVANELLSNRANFYQYHYPNTKVVVGDITQDDIKESIIQQGIENDVKLLIATPPCQGMSNLGKRDYDNDERNYLIFHTFDIIDALDFDYILIENVPQFLKMYYPYKGDIKHIVDIIEDKYGSIYNISASILDAGDYGVPQRRLRAILRMWKKDKKWELPKQERRIVLKEAIGYLPSLESGQTSSIKYHNALVHNERHIECLKHTPTGHSAHENKEYFPKKKDGTKVKGYQNTYRRLSWDEICPTRTMNSGSISGSNNCHPGRLLKNGLYSDARTLTLLELLIVSSLPKDYDLPENYNETFVRGLIGEGVPPLLMKKVLEKIEL